MLIPINFFVFEAVLGGGGVHITCEKYYKPQTCLLFNILLLMFYWDVNHKLGDAGRDLKTDGIIG